MKVAIALLAVVALATAAPQPRKVFHENFQDFLDVIAEEAGEQLGDIMDQYFQFEEFLVTINYLRTANFRDLVYEMEDLPEFKAVQDFLESHSVDITYFIDLLNELIERDPSRRGLQTRQAISGRDFNSFVLDSIAVFPKESLAALFDEKIAEDADFAAAMEGLQSDELEELLDDLWDNEVFSGELEALAANGVDVDIQYVQLLAIFGQNSR